MKRVEYQKRSEVDTFEEHKMPISCLLVQKICVIEQCLSNFQQENLSRFFYYKTITKKTN